MVVDYNEGVCMQKYVVFTCVRCKKSLGKLTPKGIFHILDSRGMVYKCCNCGRRYQTTAFTFFIHLAVAGSLLISGLIFSGYCSGSLYISLLVFALFLIYYAAFMPLKPVVLKMNNIIK